MSYGDGTCAGGCARWRNGGHAFGQGLETHTCSAVKRQFGAENLGRTSFSDKTDPVQDSQNRTLVTHSLSKVCIVG